MSRDPSPLTIDHEQRAAIVPRNWTRALIAMSVLGLLCSGIGMFVSPERVGMGVLVGAFYVLGLSLAGLMFLTFHNLSGAIWSIALKRIPEAMALTLPVAALLGIAVLALIPTLYEWSHADVVAADPLLQAKTAWLNPSFFSLRTVACVVVWFVFSYAMVTLPRRRESSANGDKAHKRPIAWSGAFLVIFALTFSVISFDWIMSLEPHWFSTVFAVYNFSGLFVGGLAAITFFAILLRRLGPLSGVISEDHYHDLGKLLFGFTTFWAYIWFCQYMLIWYTNMPEETSYFLARQEGPWNVVFLLNLLVNWLIPFFVLLPRGAKRKENVLLSISVLLIFGRWLDLYLMVNPAHASEPHLGVWEIAPVLGALSLFLLAFLYALRRAPLVPRSDPDFAESLHFHQ